MGPSVAGWVLQALGPDDPLAAAARHYLVRTLSEDGMWRGHEAFYATPFYPSHLCIGGLEAPDSVVRWTLDSVGPGGAWGFGDPPAQEPSVLPTAWALLTLLAVPMLTAESKDVARGAVSWLIGSQEPGGGFAAEPRPPGLFYTGRLYATAVAIMALVRAQEVLGASP
jgi:hypothetical protein